MIYFKSFKTTFNTWKLRELDELEAMRRMTYKWNIISYVENLRKTTTLNTWRWLRLTCLKKQQRFWMGKKIFTYATKACKIASRTVILPFRPYAVELSSHHSVSTTPIKTFPRRIQQMSLVTYERKQLV